MAQQKTQIEYVSVDNLKAYERNARTHSDEQVQQVAESIKEFGFTNPVLIDENNELIAGHGRTMAAKSIGMKEVPAIRLKGLTAAQKKALRIADNQLALNAGWDEELLRIELGELQELDFNLDVMGFSDEELDLLLDGRSTGKTLRKSRNRQKTRLSSLANFGSLGTISCCAEIQHASMILFACAKKAASICI